MKLIKNNLILITLIYLLIQIVNWYLIVTHANYEEIISFVSICLVFIYSLIVCNKDLNSIFILIALLFTMISDVFLVLIYPRIQTIAMTTFSIAQLMYYLKLLVNVKNIKLNLICRILIIILMQIVTIVVLKGNTDYLSLISIFYYTNLVLNVILAFLKLKHDKIFAIALLLFLCCDTIIGLKVGMGNYFHISSDSIIYKVLELSINLEWLFYLPSQVLISLSLYNRNDCNFKLVSTERL